MLNTLVDAQTGDPICACSGCNGGTHPSGGSRCKATMAGNGAKWKLAPYADGKLYNTCAACIEARGKARPAPEHVKGASASDPRMGSALLFRRQRNG